MADIHLSVEIAAAPARVWSALCDPAEVAAWDSGVEAALDAPPDYPQPGQHVQWRCRGGSARVLHDRPLEVVPEKTLRSDLRLGFVRYDETYTLMHAGEGTLLEVDLDVFIEAPWFIRLFVSRLQARVNARTSFEESLQNLKCHCEGEATTYRI
ncbi:MAG: SRPBCC family protein [Dehalococcoidia bacterium]